MVRNFSLLVILLALLVSGLPSQERDVFAPFPSRLKAAVRGPQIKLTWKDSSDLEGMYYVYRSRSEIAVENFKDAVLVGKVEPGQESFIDAPSQPGEFYYAVLAKGKDGRLFDVFIPFRNKTMKGIAIETTAKESELAAEVTQIKAGAADDHIIVRFKASRADRELILFRSTSPILAADQLSLANTVRKLPSSETEAADYPVPGIPYYYAVVDARLLATEIPVLKPGENTSVDFAEIPLAAQKAAEAFPRPEVKIGRVLPLPYYLLSADIATGRSFTTRSVSGLPVTAALQPQTEKAAAKLLQDSPGADLPNPEPELLDANKLPGTAQEEYTLHTVLTGSFAQRDWAETQKQLDNFLHMHLSAEVAGQAYFYRAQALFFQGRLPESFMDFLLSSKKYYTESRVWIDRILRFRRARVSPSAE